MPWGASWIFIAGQRIAAPRPASRREVDQRLARSRHVRGDGLLFPLLLLVVVVVVAAGPSHLPGPGLEAAEDRLAAAHGGHARRHVALAGVGRLQEREGTG